VTEKAKTAGNISGISALSALAMEKIAAHRLSPTPEIYELWFRYYQGDAEIARAIDAHQGAIDEAFCHKLHTKHLSESARNDSVRKISEQIQQAISGLGAALHSVKSATSEYSETLEGAARDIGGAQTIDDLARTVSSIVEDTKMMARKNQELEFQLTSSSTQVAELRKNLDSATRDAMTDGLTGLANRKAFDKQIADWVAERSSGGALCLIMLDIDHFKTFNDNYGHQTGDQVLKLVARALTDGIKGRDFAARFGGEEFAIILPETPLSAAIKVADALRKSVEDKEVVNRTSNTSLGRITLSAGVAELKAGESVADFIERTDAALYAAKRAGRNRVQGEN